MAIKHLILKTDSGMINQPTFAPNGSIEGLHYMHIFVLQMTSIKMKKMIMNQAHFLEKRLKARRVLNLLTIMMIQIGIDKS